MEERVSCTVKEFSEYFNFEQVSGDEKALYRKIRVPNTNRPGLELTGFYDQAEHKRIVIIGNKETAFLAKWIVKLSLSVLKRLLMKKRL